MNVRVRIAFVALLAALVPAGPAFGHEITGPFGDDVAECALHSLPPVIDPPSITCVHGETDEVHHFANFSEMVLHMLEEHAGNP